MADDSAEDKTESASAKKLSDARKKGQVPRSKDLGTMFILIVSAVALIFLGEDIATSLMGMFSAALTFGSAEVFSEDYMISNLVSATLAGMLAILPFMLLVLLAVFMAPMLVGGFFWSWESLGFKFSRLDPIGGLKKIFSARGLMELFKSLWKVAIVGGIAVVILDKMSHEIMSISQEPIDMAIEHAGSIMVWSYLWISLGIVIVAFIDAPFQLWKFAEDMKMSKQEKKDEHKQEEGDPKVKGRIRNLQMQFAMKRMMQDVPTADVVITNPEHFAVALKYEQGKTRAPVVVAKGADIVAAHIRNIAIKSGVVIVSAPPLARAIYYSTKVGREIPDGLYVALAQILAYVYQIKVADKNGSAIPVPPKESDLPIPDALRRD